MALSFSTLINVMLFSIMLAMGASLSWDSFKHALKYPKPFLVGMLSQFALLPFLAYLIVLGLDLSAVMGLGLLMIACTPGGSTSNLYTYYAKGDVALSISMTVASSLAATFMMPLLLKFYSYMDAMRHCHTLILQLSMVRKRSPNVNIFMISFTRSPLVISNVKEESMEILFVSRRQRQTHSYSCVRLKFMDANVSYIWNIFYHLLSTEQN